MASSFFLEFAIFTFTIMEEYKIKEDGSMLFVGIALVLIGVFLIGKSSK